jgi:putative oxidoreductase
LDPRFFNVFHHSPRSTGVLPRGLFCDYFNIRVLLAEVTGVDTKGQEIVLGRQRVPYDYLVLATGASHSYFGRDMGAVCTGS